MSDFVWWALFAILSLLLVMFTFRLCCRIITDVYCDSSLPSENSSEDLTRYKINSSTIYKNLEYKNLADNISLKNEVMDENDAANVVPIVEETLLKSKSDAEEKITITDLQNNVEFENEDIVKNDDAQKKETYGSENYTEEERKIFEQILGIKGEVDIYAQQIPYCLGGKQHLQYFEINQTFLMNLITLGSIDCKNNEVLQRRKQMLSVYIQDCQNELKKKAGE